MTDKDVRNAEVLLQIDAGIATLTLNRAEKGNAMSAALMTSLLDGVHEAEADADCHVLVIRGEGKVFCAGGDLGDLWRGSSDPELQNRMVTTLQDTMFALASSRLIVIAAVNGAAAGAGLGLALNCDLIIASTRAKFVGAYGAIGLSPDAGVSYLLPAAIGAKRAAAVLIAGTPVSAQEALDWGLAIDIVDPDGLDARAHELAHRLAGGATQAMPATKQLIGASALAGYRAHLDAEATSIASFASHPDTEARIAAMRDRSAVR